MASRADWRTLSPTPPSRGPQWSSAHRWSRPHWGGPLGHARDASRRSVEAPTSASAPLARRARGAEPGGSGSWPVGGSDPWAPGRV